MKTDRKLSVAAHIRSAQVVVPCSDLTATMGFFVEQLGFRVDVIFPADAPTAAVISGHGTTLRLEEDQAAANHPPLNLRLLCDLSALPSGTPRQLLAPGGTRIVLAEANPAIELPDAKQEFVVSRLGGADAWGAGRASMQYRDLIPSRLGGRFIASHIRIPEGGPVPDYVHYHKVRFQMIFCKAGWVRLVYEDQGPPFVLNAGDCVLQPPEIRHRVLEASAGLEVIEIGCPAVHETFADHDMPLPTTKVAPGRVFGGQQFVRHVAANAKWGPWHGAGFEARDTGIGATTNGLAGVRVVRSAVGAKIDSLKHEGEFLFFFVLRGELGVRSSEHGEHRLRESESCVISAGARFELIADAGLEMLEVALPEN
jgi:quercetin dioxygenase-like cupin family protein